MTRIAHGRDFLEWLRKAGIVPENCRRVVIDASVGSVTTIYVEQYATVDMLTVEPPAELLGARVIVVGEQKSDSNVENRVED